PRTPIFWRDARMPHVELRKVADGREVCYALHTHRHWSIGAITGGESTFLYRTDQYHVSAGTLVLMNPEWPHAYLINRRIQHGQSELKRGVSIADAALNAGFADQAHFQRTFKRVVAATPNQYRQPSIQQQEHATSGK
nr:helix-turn-helix domain-containing protein [Marinobacter nauticus]